MLRAPFFGLAGDKVRNVWGGVFFCPISHSLSQVQFHWMNKTGIYKHIRDIADLK
ncbi:Uncharacterised protein [Paenibacillus thiaminolyticus]|nr:Uncharacterised protein [Paenibacillus thiaminolyticus]